MAEFAAITYESAHTDPASPNRCRCGVPVDVSHFCSLLDHAWVPARPRVEGCLYHRDDPYPAGCADCADVQRSEATEGTKDAGRGPGTTRTDAST